MSNSYNIEGSKEFVFHELYGKDILKIRFSWFLIGCLFMSILDLTDIHICVGDCDSKGYDVMDITKVQRK